MQDNERENVLYILMNIPFCVYKIKKKAIPMCGLQCILLLTFYIQNTTSIYYPWSSAAKTLSRLRTFGWNTGVYLVNHDGEQLKLIQCDRSITHQFKTHA